MIENKMTFQNALELMNKNPNSQFEILQHRQHIKLSPKHIGNVKAGVSEVLKSRLYFYNNEIGAVPMAFRNVKALQKYGTIIADQPCLHFDIDAEFITFKPTIGCKLKGVINKVSKQHVGCLVHGCFNGWFPLTDIGETDEKKLVGKRTEFIVEKIFASNKVVSFRGRFSQFLTDEDDCNGNTSPLDLSEIGSPNSSMVPLFTSTQLHTPAPELEPNSKKHKKKKLKHKELDLTLDLSTDNAFDTETNETAVSVTNESDMAESSSSKHKKKKKKHKKSDTQEDDSVNETVGEASETEPVENVTHEKTKHAKKKKRKAEQELPDSSEEFMSPKKKVKTKKETKF